MTRRLPKTIPYTSAEDTLLNVAAPGVLANDSDVDSALLTANVVSGPPPMEY